MASGSDTGHGSVQTRTRQGPRVVDPEQLGGAGGGATGEERRAEGARGGGEVLERDNGGLKRDMTTLHGRLEEAERAAGELRKKATEMAAANYALGVQARGGADSCRFQVFRGPDVF
nr:unnamed protein product [Digitaria exilis]